MGGWITCFLFLLLWISVPALAETSGSASASLNASQTTCTVSLKDYKMPTEGAAVTAAVWSEKNGQDDLKWRDMALNNGAYSVQFPVSEHKTDGRYFVHLYLRTKHSQMVFLNSTTFTVTPTSCSSVAVGTVDTEGCRVTVSGITCPSGVKKVQIPVWCKNDQSDIVWYDAVKQTDGSWTADIRFARHGSHLGIYKVHAYILSGNGMYSYVGNTSFEYTGKQQEQELKLTAELSGHTCKLKAEGVTHPEGVRQISFAVWSQTDGQDDLHWSTVSCTGGTAQKTIDLQEYCDFGLYYVHVYAVTGTGKMTYVGKTSFELPYPSASSVKAEVKGTEFTVRISGISCVAGIDRITVPVWSKSDQSDIVWYKATKQSDGSYLVKSDISRHKNNLGLYQVHVYLYDDRDSYGHRVGNITFRVEEEKEEEKPVNSAGKLTVTANSDKSVFTATISDLTLAKNYQRLTAPTWSAEKGQDDIHWYEAVQSGSSCQVKIPMSNHGDEGIYYLHLYGVTASGGMEFIKGYQFEIARSNVLTFKELTEGSAVVSLKLSSDIKATRVLFPVWCASDQSDIKWYTAVKQSDGSYTATIDVANHKNHSGSYKVHAYYYDQSGSAHLVAHSTIQLGAVQEGQAGITSCVIQGGSTVTVTASVTAEGTYGLFRLEPGSTSISSSASPLATVSGSGTITLKTPLKADTEESLINEKLVVAQKRSTGYVPVSNPSYITNPEAAASITRAFPSTATKKGLQVNTTMADDAAELGVNHAVVNVVLNNIPCREGGIAYQYNGKTWHMNTWYINALDEIFAEQAANGSVVSAILLMQWNSEWSDLILESGREPGHSFYGLNAETRSAREQLAAIFSFLANRYSDSGHNVVNWILGNEVDDYTDYNWCGNIGLQQYAACYAHAYRLLYNSVRSQYSNARVYISLDHVWNYYRSYGFKGQELFNAFVAELQREGDINWNIAFHPYPNPITSPNFWKNKSGVTNSSNSAIFTMLNLRYLTDYIKNTYGAQHRFILSETGFTSVTGSVSDEKLQAAAIAYGYYLAEFNDMVDSFVVHRHVDHQAETSQGLYLGLWYTDPAYDEIASEKKFSWTVFKYMDTSQGAAYTNFALSIIGANSWSSIVPGYSAARFN
ncbi:MAG: DUF5722 domain-containing protein [Lachnospiraceae bacterium]|nr:DUF5722 domain-containing protein [Lachnospiraceae bacterium]